MTNYEVWLHARDPHTMELIATLRVFTHADRLAAETALENAACMFDQAHLRLPFGSVVTTHMRGPGIGGGVDYRALLVRYMARVLAEEEYSFFFNDAGLSETEKKEMKVIEKEAREVQS